MRFEVNTNVNPVLALLQRGRVNLEARALQYDTILIISLYGTSIS